MKVTIDMKASAGNGIRIENIELMSRHAAERMIQAIRRQMDLVWPPEKKEKPNE